MGTMTSEKTGSEREFVRPTAHLAQNIKEFRMSKEEKINVADRIVRVPSNYTHGQRTKTRNRDLGRKQREEVLPDHVIVNYIHADTTDRDLWQQRDLTWKYDRRQ